MKSYRTEDRLRLVGKAWEIRHYLRRLAASSLTLDDYLNAGRRGAAASAAATAAAAARGGRRTASRR